MMLDNNFEAWLRLQSAEYLNFLYNIYDMLSGSEPLYFSLYGKLPESPRTPLKPAENTPQEQLNAFMELMMGGNNTKDDQITEDNIKQFTHYLNQQYPNAPKE